jgi:hypothetical protein
MVWGERSAIKKQTAARAENRIEYKVLRVLIKVQLLLFLACDASRKVPA